MKKSSVLFVFLLALSFLAVSSQAHAFVERCPRHSVKTQMKNKLAKTNIFRGTTRGFTEYVMGHSRGDSRILGFVDYGEIGTQFQGKFSVITIAPGKFCVKLEEIKGYFYAYPKLYMPTDYKKSSCEYKEVLKHEKRHLNTLYAFHKKYSKQFEAQLGRIARAVPIPNPVPDMKQAEQVQHELMNHFVGEFAKFEGNAMNLLQKEQMKIDSPQEYRGVSLRCENW